jgi:hypothetical protein
MVGFGFCVSLFFRDYNRQWLANGISHTHGIYDLYNVRFWVKEWFCCAHGIKKPRSIAFC